MKWKYVIIGITLFFLISTLAVLIKYPGLIPSDELKEAEQYSLSKFNQTQIKDSNLVIETLYTDLANPTKMTFIGSNLLIAHKNSGQISLLKDLILQKEPILDLNVESYGERGLIGLSSTTIDNKVYVFVYYTSSFNENDHYTDWFSPNYLNNDGSILVRYTMIDDELVEPKTLLHPILKSKAHHQGGSMVTKDDILFLGVGDNNNDPSPLTNSNSTSEFLDKGAGIFSVDIYGNPNPQNPFLQNELKNYFSYGIRNIYGLSIDPLTGNLWDTENGPSDFDEINLVFPGFNSGWSKIMGPSSEGLFSANPDELIYFEGAKYSDPEFSWKKTIAPTGMEFFKSKNLGTEYENNLFVGDVHGNLYYFKLNEERNGFVFSDDNLTDNISDSFEESEKIILGKNFGLITDIKTGPDGNLYILSLHYSETTPGVIEHQNYFKEGIKEPEIAKGALFRILHK